jgi:hypothetical protein
VSTLADRIAIAALVASHADLCARVAALEARLAPRVCSRDAAQLETLLPEIYAAVQSRPFFAADLADHLPASMATTIGSAHRLGRLFGRCAGVQHAGFAVVLHEKTARDGAMWRVVRAEKESNWESPNKADRVVPHSAI